MSVVSCGAIFATLHLLANAYHALYHDVELLWAKVLMQTVLICTAGALGFLAGSVLLAQDFSVRTISIIAVFGYFVSYSITNLLGAAITSPWLFLISVFVVTAFVTVKIGPRWDRRSN